MTLSSSKERDLPPRPPAQGWGAVASVLGAVLRGLREGDKGTRRRVSAVTGGVSILGLVTFLLQWGTGYLDRRAERDERRDVAFVEALKDLSAQSKANTEALVRLTVQTEVTASASQKTSDDIEDFIKLMAQREGLRPVAPRRVTATAAPMETRR